MLHHEPRIGRMLLWIGAVLVSAHLIASSATALAMWRIDIAEVAQSNKARERMIEQIEAQGSTGDSSANTLNAFGSIMSRRFLRPKLTTPSLGAPHFVKAIAYPLVHVTDANHRDNLGGAGAGPSWRIKPIRFWRDPFLITGLGMTLAYWVMLSLLPWTRRSLRIRQAHLLRGLAFGMTWLLVRSGEIGVKSTIDLYRLLTSDGVPPQLWSTNRWESSWPIWTIGVWIWIATWWYFAITRGFRFRRPILHWTVLTVIATMVGLALVDRAQSPKSIAPLFHPTHWFESWGYAVPFSPSGLWHNRVDSPR